MFRRKKLGPGRGRLTIRLYGPASADEITSGVIEPEADAEVLPHALGAYFDKILFNLSRMPSEQQNLLDRFEEFVYEVCENMSDELDSSIHPLAQAVPLSDSSEGKPLAEIRVEVMLMEEQRRIGATTHFTPLRAMNETVAELGLWALNDWLVVQAGGSEETLHSMYDNLAEQCDYYRTHGMPSALDLGRAPFEAAAEGARRREATGSDASEPATEIPQTRPAGVDRAVLDEVAQQLLGAPDFESWIAQVRDSGFVRVWPRWEELHRERGSRPVEGKLLDAIEQRVKRLDWGEGDLIKRVLAGAPAPSVQEGAVGILLTRIAFGGYLWREAERQVGTVLDRAPLDYVEHGLSFAREQPSSREKEGEELVVTAAFWAMEGLAAPLTVYGGLQEPLSLVVDATAEEIRKQSGWDVNVPPRSRNDAFLYGYVLRELEAAVT